MICNSCHNTLISGTCLSCGVHRMLEAEREGDRVAMERHEADAALGRVWREAINMERAQWAVDQWVATGDETPLHEAGLIGSFLCLLRAELRKERGRG